MTWDRVKGRLKIAWPAVGLLVGLSAGACFLYLHAWETAGFALVSGAYALLLMSFTIKSYLNLKAVERCDELTTDEEVASLYDEQDDENNSNEPYYASSGTIQHKASMRDRHHSRRGHLVAERPESWTWWTYRWACFVAAAAGASVGTSGIIAYALLAHGNHESLSPTSHWLTIASLSRVLSRRLRENYEAVRGTSLAKDEVYAEYMAFCEADGKDPMLPSMFGKMVHRAFPGLKSSRTGAKGKAKHCYKGFRVRAPGGKVSMTVTVGEDEEEMIDEAELFGDDNDHDEDSRSSSSSTTATYHYGSSSATIPSGSSSSSSPTSSPLRLSGTSKPAPHSHRQVSPGGGRLNSSSPSSVNESRFSSPTTGAAHHAPLSPPMPYGATDASLIAPFPQGIDSSPSFLDMLQSPTPSDYMPLPPHPQPLHHQLMRSRTMPVHPQHRQPQQQQQQQQQYMPPHHQVPTGMPPLPHAYPSNYPYAPPYVPPVVGRSSPSPPPSNSVCAPQPTLASADSMPTTTTTPSASSTLQQQQQQPRIEASATSPIDCVPSPTSEFFFPPYISPLSVPLPFLPSFSFSLPPPSPPPSGTGAGVGRGLAGGDGMDSYSNSSSAPSSSSSSPSNDASLCYERDYNAQLYAPPGGQDGFRMLEHQHAQHQLHHHQHAQQQQLQQQQLQQQLRQSYLVNSRDRILAHEAARLSQSPPRRTSSPSPQLQTQPRPQDGRPGDS